MRCIRKTLLSAGVFVIVITNAATAQTRNENDVASLYRTGVLGDNTRYHIATFDSREVSAGGTRFDYNWTNCMIAADLYKSQSNVAYWCEKGFSDE